MPSAWGMHLAVALVSASVMLAEIVALRDWKVSLGMEAAYLMVPTVMAGMAVGAALAFFVARWWPARLPALTWTSAVAFAVILPVQFVVLAQGGGFDSRYVGRALSDEPLYVSLQWTAGTWAAIAFALAGLVQTLVFRLAPRSSASLYCATLLGSAAAVFGLTPLLDAFQMQGCITLAAMLAVLVVPCLASSAFSRRLSWAVGIVVAVAVAAFLPAAVVVRVYGDEALFAGSNSIAHVEISDLPAEHASRGTAPAPPQVKVKQIAVDDRTSTLTFVYPNLADCSFLLAEPGALAYFRKPRRVLVCGAGGGQDVLQALLSGAEEVTAVEINPLVVESSLRVGSGVYREPRVRLVLDDARRFLATHPDERWDAIVLPRVKTYGAGSGFVVNVKNYMLTREALALCLRHLSPEGTLVIRDARSTFRWHLDTLVGALAMGGEGPAPVAVHDKGTSMVFFSPRAFTMQELKRLRTELGRRQAMRVSPSELEQSRRGDFLTTDDRPITIRTTVGEDEGAMKNNRLSRFDYPRLLAFVAGGLLLVALPATALRPPRGRRVSTALIIVGGLLLGTGYMLVELALMDFLTPFIGHPMWATTVAIGTLLLGGGLGSLRLTGEGRTPRLRAGLLGLLAAALLGVTYAGLQMFQSMVAGEAVRIAVAASLVAAPAFLMGAPLPLLLEALGEEDPSYIPWLWTSNGVGALLAGLWSRPVSFELGLSSMYALGVAVYALAAAAFCLSEWRRR